MKKVGKKFEKKLAKSCQKSWKKLAKSCQKSCQKDLTVSEWVSICINAVDLGRFEPKTYNRKKELALGYVLRK